MLRESGTQLWTPYLGTVTFALVAWFWRQAGFFAGAGYSIAVTAQRNGQRVIAVVMGSVDRKVRDAKAAEFYSTFEKDPELAIFLRKLEVMEQTLKEKSTVVLSADTVPYDLLTGVEALPKK